jgi:type II secretory pathway pseudopilin PulG
MLFLRKKPGFSLVELILSLSIGMVIIITGVIWGSNRLKEANARNNEQKVMITLKNLENYIVTNSPDGTSKALNPLTNDILIENELIPFDANKVGQWLYDKDLGNMQVGYSTDYPSSNVIELRVKDIDNYTCSRFISRLPGKVLELKLGASYLPYTSKVVPS